MAGDQLLFLKLAEALGQDSRPLRAVKAGAQIPFQAMEGYDTGAQFGDRIRQRKFKDSPVGSYFESGTPPDGFKKDIPVDAFAALAPFAKQDKSSVIQFVTPEQATAMGVDPKVINSFGGKPIPRLLAQSNVTSNLGADRNKALNRMAGTREAQVGLGATKAAMQYGGAGAAQGAIKESFNRIAQIHRTRGLLQQIQDQGGQANPQQRGELAMSVGRTLNPSGVLTDQAMKSMLPNSAVGKYGDAMQFLTNAPYDTEFQGFANRFSDLLDREEKLNTDIVQGGGKYAEPFKKFGAQVESGGGQDNDPLGLFK